MPVDPVTEFLLRDLGGLVVALLNIPIIILSVVMIVVGIQMIGGLQDMIIKGIQQGNLQAKLSEQMLNVAMDVASDPYVEQRSRDIAMMMILTGGFLLLVSACGCYGACCEDILALQLFCFLSTVMIVCEIGMMILHGGSEVSITAKLKDQGRSMIKQKYRLDINNTFSRSFDATMMLKGCCGVEGPEDFREVPLSIIVNGVNETLEVPFPCCNKTVDEQTGTPPPKYIEVVDCAKTKPTKAHKLLQTKGCFEDIFGSIDASLSTVFTVLILAFCTQVFELIVASYILWIKTQPKPKPKPPPPPPSASPPSPSPPSPSPPSPSPASPPKPAPAD